MSEARDLPAILAEIADVAGLAAALKMAAAFGGREVYVPERMHPSHKIAQAVGIDAAIQIARLYPRESIVVPLGPASNARRVATAIVDGLASGASKQEVARRTGSHVRTVYRHHERLGGTDTDQSDLFSDD